MHCIKTVERHRSIFLASLALYFLVLWPILRADRFYIDDLGRSLSGYLGWGKDGRPLSNVVMEVLNLGTPLTDLSPLPQLLCLAIFAYLAVAVAKRFDIPGVWRAPLIVAPMIASPFFLENLSYKFDSLTMSLAVGFAAMTVLAIPYRGVRLLLGAMALIASLCLYQPAFNVFLIFCIAEVTFAQMQQARLSVIGRLIGVRLLQAVLALGTYKLIAANGVRGEYASRHAEMSGVPGLLETLSRNLSAYASYVMGGLASPFGYSLLAILGLGLLLTALIAVRYVIKTYGTLGVPGRTATIIAAILLPLLLAVAVWGPMLALSAPVLVPRVMVGVGALATVALLLFATLVSRSKLPGKWQTAVVGIPVYSLIAFASVYGNTLGLQKEYEQRISAQITDDLSELQATDGVVRYLLQGHADRPAVALHNIRKFPLLTALVPVHLTEGWGWAGEQLRHAGTRISYSFAPYGFDVKSSVCALSPAKVRSAYQAYVVRDAVVIVFGNGAMGCSEVMTRQVQLDFADLM